MALMYGKVVATVIEVRGDSTDAGSEPDVIGATSVEVNFQPKYTSVVSSQTRRIVNVKPSSALLTQQATCSTHKALSVSGCS